MVAINTPLLGDDGEVIEVPPKTTTAQTVMNIYRSFIGAGLLGMPFSFYQVLHLFIFPYMD